MPRIIVQTDDRCTVLEHDVSSQELADDGGSVDLIAELHRALQDAEMPPRRRISERSRRTRGKPGLHLIRPSTAGPFE
jgi:hypothetical protein